jgi:hypothetical protein
MKTKLLVAGLVSLSASLSGCIVVPAYDGPGYYGSAAVVVAPPPVIYHGGYYGPYRGGHRYHGPYRRW